MTAAFNRAVRLARLLALTLPLLLAAPAGADETLSYDANGNVEMRTLPGGTTTYGYDELNRVNSEAGPAKTQSLTYDPNGNRTGDASGTHTYAGSSDRQLTIAGQSISLDAAGHVTQARGLNFTWNQAGQLKTVSQGGTLLATYTYDYQGRRSRKVSEGAGSLSSRTTLYVYDLYDRLISELNGTGNPLRTYVWRDDIPVALIIHGSETVLYLETDHLNTPIAARNQAGTVVWKWESDAFGSTPANEDPDGDGISTTINLRFPGQYFDKESGLHYNHHRYYDPKLGRYISSDPIGLAGGINLFGYVGGNPLSFSDAEGLTRRAAPPGPSNPNIVSNSSAQAIINQIRQYDPNFSPPQNLTLPGQGGYTAAQARQLATILQQLRQQNVCTPNFVVTPSSTALPVPQGSGLRPIINNSGAITGQAFSGGAGGSGLDPSVSTLRLMNPTQPNAASPGYPNGYGNYMNSQGQSVNPSNGQTLNPSDPMWHIKF